MFVLALLAFFSFFSSFSIKAFYFSFLLCFILGFSIMESACSITATAQNGTKQLTTNLGCHYSLPCGCMPIPLTRVLLRFGKGNIIGWNGDPFM